MRDSGKFAALWNRQYGYLFLVNLVVSLTLYMTNTHMAQHLSGLGIGAAAAGSVIGAMSMASMAVRPVSGIVCDRFDRRTVLLISTSTILLVLLGYALARSAPVFLMLRALHGAAFGMTTTVTMALVTEYIPKDRMGEGLGYFGLGQSVAAAVGPLAGISLALRFGGASVFVAAAAAVAAGFCLALMIRPAAGRAAEGARRALRPGDFIAKEAVPFAVITVALSAANGIETSYIASYAETFQIANIGWYFTLSAAVMFAARLLFGRITDRKGFIWALVPGIALIVAALVALSRMSSETARVTFAAAAVMKACGVGVLQPGIQAMCVQSVLPSRRGAASSTYYIGTDLGQGASVMVAGRLISGVGYSAMFGLYALPLAAVLVFYLLIKNVKRGSL